MNKAPTGSRRLCVRMLTVEKTAEQLDVSQKTVRRLIDSGELVAHRIGRNIRIAGDDLRAFVNQRRG